MSGLSSQAQQAPWACLLCQGARAARVSVPKPAAPGAKGRIPWASNSIPSGDSQQWTKAQQVQKKNPKGLQKELCFKCWMKKIEVTAALCFRQQTPTSPTTLAPTQASKFALIWGFALLQIRNNLLDHLCRPRIQPRQPLPSKQGTVHVREALLEN